MEEVPIPPIPPKSRMPNPKSRFVPPGATFALQCGGQIMALVRSQDRVLLVALLVALFVVFAKPVEYVLDLAADVHRASGLDLLPALLILTVVFIVHQRTKRQEAKTMAAASAAVARQAETRAAEMERLVAFGQALARSLDVDAIREVVQRRLPGLVGTPRAWVAMRVDGHWRAIAGSPPWSPDQLEVECERMADRALAPDGPVQDVVLLDEQMWLPVAVAGQPVAMLGLPAADAPDESRTGTLAAAASLLGLSLRNAQLFRDLREHSVRDGLTGCFNRSHAMDVLDAELRRARRSQAPLSLIMFDLDRFKDVNDRFGHLCGDAVLAAVGERMREVLRGSDLKCRYGGEEFLVLLPDTPIEGARRVAESLRRELASRPFTWKNEPITVTASFGVTAALPAEINTEAVVGRADAALYRAKDEGRNCVRVASEIPVA